MRRGLLLATLGVLLAASLALAVRERPPEAAHEGRVPLAVARALGAGETEGFARAEAPRSFRFPADHGPHPEFRTEWWYFTGNLETSAGRRFGYQLTFFRNALAAAPPARSSAWAARHVWMAHFAVTDVEMGRLRAFERFSRDGNGLAGARSDRLHVWLEDWSAQGTAGDPLVVHLRAAAPGQAIALALEAVKPHVLHGEAGLSHKSPLGGDASYYYSYTRMRTSGRVRVGEERFEVRGASWLDREWSTSALASDQLGWDWFAIQLDDGAELMCFRLRSSADPTSGFGATWIAADGTSRSLVRSEVEIRVQRTWGSPDSGAVYPAEWTLRVPSERLELVIAPLVPDQELDLSVRYWEGAVAVRGQRAGRPIQGRGYVELTGYTDAAPGAPAPAARSTADR